MRRYRLKRLFESVSGGSWGTEPEEAEVALPCVRGTDFDYRVLRTNADRAPVRGFSRSEVDKRSARRGDLIIEKSGGGEQQPVGRAVLHDSDDVVMPTNFASRLSPSAVNDPQFVTYLLSSLYAVGVTKSSIKQTTGIQNLDLHSFLDTVVSCPVLREQRAIADFLDAETARIDALIAKKRRVMFILNTRLATLVYNLIFAEPAVKRVRLGRVVSILPGYAFASSDFRDDGEDMIRLLRGINVAPGRCRWDEVAYLPEAQMSQHQAYALRPGDLVLGMDRPFISEGTRLATVRKVDVPALLVQRVARMRAEQALDQQYLSFALHSNVFKDHCAPITTGVSVPHISADQIADFRIPLPDRKIQERIVGRLANNDGRISMLQGRISRQLDLLAQHRQALITAAVTGEIGVPGVGASGSGR